MIEICPLSRIQIRYLFFILILGSIGAAAQADVTLPSIFGDHMVLQQEAKLPVWGSADPGETVTVTVGDHKGSAVAGKDGKWRVDLDPFADGAATTTMSVTGKNRIEFKDVAIGEVWLCSGQSNMETTLSYAYNGNEEAAKAKDPKLRLFFVVRTPAIHPLSDVHSPYYWKPWTGKAAHESDGERPGTWVVCEPHSATQFSAVAFFFGRATRTHFNRPVGIIESAWGGTCAEAWISLEGLQRDPPFKTYIQAYEKNLADFAKLEPQYRIAQAAYQKDLKEYDEKYQQVIGDYQAAVKAWKAAGKESGATSQPSSTMPTMPAKSAFPIKPKAPVTPEGGSAGPTNLYNGMIAPLIPYAIKGVVWYQGESNSRSKAFEYRLLLPRLIADWRDKWGDAEMPFVYAQISHFPYAEDGSSALVREAELKTLSVPKTAMAVLVDIPCDDPGHPRDKIDAGNRLALAARHVAYGEDIVFSGPLYESMKIDGSAIEIHFTQIDGGLIIGKTPYQPPGTPKRPIAVLPTDKLVGFTIAGSDKKFVAAEATIAGDTVRVSSPAVASPVAVRFAWGDAVECNLYNKGMLPASPFRTDEWNDFKFRELAPGLTPPTFGAADVSGMR